MQRVSFSVPEGLKGRLDERAASERRSVSQVVVLALEAYLGSVPGPAGLVTAPEPVGVQHSSPEVVSGVKPREVAEKLAAAVPGVELGRGRVSPKDCAHPRGHRVVKSWGTICGVCGKRL